VLPWSADPDTAGAAEFVGAPATTPLTGDTADADPDAFPAVTTTATVEPTSELPSTYVDDVAPEIGEQFAPPESQSSHW
jgi:hypothetical protein